MFVIFGLRTKAHRLGVVPAACQVCRQTAGMLLVREVTKLSLFFVPLLPVRRKHALYCANPMCGARIGIDAGEARRLLTARVGSAH